MGGPAPIAFMGRGRGEPFGPLAMAWVRMGAFGTQGGALAEGGRFIMGFAIVRI